MTDYIVGGAVRDQLLDARMLTAITSGSVQQFGVMQALGYRASRPRFPGFSSSQNAGRIRARWRAPSAKRHRAITVLVFTPRLRSRWSARISPAAI
ncbi:MAG: hypothetical protein IPJ38_21450 [Dechloromonas sp.]|uniref:Uncharacterized protein n=1 Tax=Candidatus Dechloromonas phosphorivorans TaxID=2899244 RepID=A0A935MXK9_9RHOO|nr:hypothetical protein [Candidatus Dechloromonas phosphorivorans]